MKLKVLSWNIWIYGHHDEICSFLKDADAGIIGLQEVQDDDPGRDVIGFLAKLGYKHIFQPVPKTGKRNVRDGPALFTKFPIKSFETYSLSSKNNRAAVRVDIEVEDTLLHIFSTHLLHTHQEYWDVQQEQAKNLLTHLPPDKTILVGDFNATPDSSIIQSVRSALKDSDPSGTPTWSMYPEGCDVCNPQSVGIRLDYIFTTPDLNIVSSKVEHSTGSDHLPISAEIEV